MYCVWKCDIDARGLYFCLIHDNSARVGSRNTLSMYLAPEYEGYHQGYGDCQIRPNDD